MHIRVIGRKAWGIEVISHSEIEEGDVISLATQRVKAEVRRMERGLPVEREEWQEPTNWAYQAGKAELVVKICSQQPGRLTVWRVEGSEYKYAASNCVLRWHRLRLDDLHCECPLNGDPCCKCGAGAPGGPEDCGVPATLAVRHQTAMALQGR